jgi:DNA-binding FadR family transcriptional regulator
MSPHASQIAGPAPAADDLFSPVTVGRTSQLIADQIRTLVREGRLKAGDRLPSERDLCERFGVSRVTVREALRVLETNGLVEIRVGARGGAIVSHPSSEALSQGLADLLTLSSLTAAQVTEARLVFEVGIIPLIVERATGADIAALRELVADGQRALDQGNYQVSRSAAFHVRLAAASHNDAVEMLVHSFHGPMLMSLREAQVAAPLMGQRGTEEHLEIVDAIEDRDPERAARVMRRHLRRTYDRVAP